MQQRVPVVNKSSSSSSPSAARVPIRKPDTRSHDSVYIIYIYIGRQCILCGTLARKLVRRDKKKKKNCIPVYYYYLYLSVCVQTLTARILFTRRLRFSWWEKLYNNNTILNILYFFTRISDYPIASSWLTFALVPTVQYLIYILVVCWTPMHHCR